MTIPFVSVVLLDQSQLQAGMSDRFASSQKTGFVGGPDDVLSILVHLIPIEEM
jgi:hypothetical protein